MSKIYLSFVLCGKVVESSATHMVHDMKIACIHTLSFVSRQLQTCLLRETLTFISDKLKSTQNLYVQVLSTNKI